MVSAIDDEDAMRLLRLFNEPAGHEFLIKQGLNKDTVAKLPYLGISSIANMLSAVKMAKYYEMNENDVIFTIFTDSAEMYLSRLAELNKLHGAYSETEARIDDLVCLKGQSVDYLKELTYTDRKRIHNLKYFTWVEQQGKMVEELNAQWYDENYWNERFSIISQWDKEIIAFNEKTGMINKY